MNEGPARTSVHSWDWRGQPDLDRLSASLLRFGVHLTQVDTGTDEYAIVLSDRPLTADEALTAWEGDDAGA